MHKGWSVLLIIYHASSWHEYKKDGALYGDFSNDNIIASPLNVIIHSTNKHSVSITLTKVPLDKFSKTNWWDFCTCTSLSTQNFNALVRGHALCIRSILYRDLTKRKEFFHKCRCC